MTLLDHLRILVALAVLKTTPAGKTYSSYIISLRDAFSSSKTPFELWKDRAQKLEKECMDLRASLAKLQIRSFIDTHASTQLAGSSEYVVPSSSDSNNLPLTKKKSKKKSDSTRTAEFEDRNLSDILKFGRIQLGRPFDAMDRFLQLCSLSERPGFPKKAFLGATRDVCSALSSALEDATRDGVNLKRLQVLQVTLCAVVDKAVPLVLSWVTEHDEALSLVFDSLLEVFIDSVVPAFLVVSERNLSYMQSPDPSGSAVSGSNHSPSSSASVDCIDGRVVILALVQATFSHIQSALSNSANKDSGGDSLALAHGELSVMILSLVLMIVRHIRDLLRLDDGHNTHRRLPTRRWRIRRLAVKDTLWYLYSMVHFLLDLRDGLNDSALKEPECQKRRLGLLTHTILDIMVDLVLHQDRKRALCFEEKYGHLMAKTIVKSPVESSSPSAVNNEFGNTQATNHLVLDDIEYRMFLSVVERFLGIC